MTNVSRSTAASLSCASGDGENHLCAALRLSPSGSCASPDRPYISDVTIEDGQPLGIRQRRPTPTPTVPECPCHADTTHPFRCPRSRRMIGSTHHTCSGPSTLKFFPRASFGPLKPAAESKQLGGIFLGIPPWAWHLGSRCLCRVSDLVYDSCLKNHVGEQRRLASSSP